MHKQHKNKFKENMNDNKTNKEDINLQLPQHQDACKKPENNSNEDKPQVKYI